MRWLGVLGVAGAAALAGCANEPGMTWKRSDGQAIDAAFQAVAAQCKDAATRVGAASPASQRHDLMVAAMEGCMARRGYKWECRHPLANPFDGACVI